MLNNIIYVVGAVKLAGVAFDLLFDVGCLVAIAGCGVVLAGCKIAKAVIELKEKIEDKFQ